MICVVLQACGNTATPPSPLGHASRLAPPSRVLRCAGWQLAARWLLPALLLLLLLLACPGALRLRQLSPAARQRAAVVWGTGGGNLPPEQLLELGLSSHTVRTGPTSAAAQLNELF